MSKFWELPIEQLDRGLDPCGGRGGHPADEGVLDRTSCRGAVEVPEQATDSPLEARAAAALAAIPHQRDRRSA